MKGGGRVEEEEKRIAVWNVWYVCLAISLLEHLASSCAKPKYVQWMEGSSLGEGTAAFSHFSQSIKEQCRSQLTSEVHRWELFQDLFNYQGHSAAQVSLEEREMTLSHV